MIQKIINEQLWIATISFLSLAALTLSGCVATTVDIKIPPTDQAIITQYPYLERDPSPYPTAVVQDDVQRSQPDKFVKITPMDQAAIIQNPYLNRDPIPSPYPPVVVQDDIQRSQPEKFVKIPPIEEIDNLLGNHPNIKCLTCEEGSEIVGMEEAPSGYGLRIVCRLPTPCHELHVDIQEPDDEGNIYLVTHLTNETRPGFSCHMTVTKYDETFALEIFDPTQNVIYVDDEPGGSLCR